MDIENKQSEVLGNSTFKRRAGALTGDHGRKYEVKLLMLYLLHGLSSKIDFRLASNVEGCGAFDDIFFEYKDQENKSRIVLVQAKHYNTHRPSKNITFEDLFIDGNDRKQQKENFGLNKYFVESYPEIQQSTEFQNSDITLVIHTNVNVNLKKSAAKRGGVETLEKYLEESTLTDDNTLNTYKGQKGACYKIKNHTELKKYFSCSSKDEIEDFLLRIRFVVDQPNHSKLDDIIKKEIGNIYKISDKKDIDMVFDSARGKLEKWSEQQGSEVSYLTRKDNYFKEAIEHLCSLKPKENLDRFWQVSIQNYNFVGRKALLDKIEECLDASDTVTLVACHGLGGIGKTQLALEFIWSRFQKYKGIIWFDAKDRNTLINEYIKLGSRLNIIRDDEGNVLEEDRAEHIKYWLEEPKRAGWLLVCDNAPNYKDIADLLPIKGGKILLTSRYTFGWPQPQNTISVDVFEPGESRSYIRKILEVKGKKLDITQVDALAKTLGHLPLALAQASFYIKKTYINISDYLKLYNDRKRTLLSDKTLLETFPPGANRETAAIVYVTWDITVEAIKKESSLAANWLTACAYLDGSPIPQFLLEIFAGNQENNPSLETFHEAFGILISYSMLTVKKDHSMLVHNLVQEVTRLKSEESGKTKEDIETVFQLLQESFPYDSDKLEDYAKKRQLLPHLEAFLSHIDVWLEEKKPSEKQTVEKYYLVLLVWMSNGYYDLGDLIRKIELLEQAIPILQKHFGPDHHEVATLLVNLGIAYNALNNPQKAKELFERALPIFKKHYGSDNPKVAVTLTNLGNSYNDLDKLQKAKKLFERALAIKEKYYGPDHLQVAITLTNLGNFYYASGNLQKAKKLLEQALPIFKRHYSSDHFQTSKLLANLGVVYGDLGDHKKGKRLLERALPIFEKHYGHDHFKVAGTVASLGNAYRDLGNPRRAKKFLEQALVIQEKHYGPDHFEVAGTLTNLSITYGDLGDHEKKKELLERALVIQEKHYGPNHFKVAITLANLGNVYHALGSPQKAKEFLERALPILEKRYDSDNPKVAIILASLGDVYEDLGNPKKAKELLERALPILEKHYDPGHFKVAKPVASLGLVHYALGDLRKAKELSERALPIFEKHYGPDHLEVAKLLANLGIIYSILGKHKKNKELLKRALPILKKHYGPDHLEVAIILISLGTSHGNLGDYEKQKELFEQALPIFEKHYGPDHPEVATLLADLGITYGALGKHKKNQELLKRALPILKKHYGPDHLEVAIILISLGISQGDLGYHEKQKELFEQALPILEKHYGSDHPEVAKLLINLSDAHGALGNHKKKKELLEQALPIFEKHYGSDHPEVIKLLAE